MDSTQGSDAALEAARRLAEHGRSTVAITGAVDYVTDGRRAVAIENGHPLMARVTGLGCSATAVIGAFLAVEPDALQRRRRAWRCLAWPANWRRRTRRAPVP